MGFDIAPYGQAIASVSDLVGGVIKRIWPEKMGELDRAKIEQETALFMATQQGQAAMNEFADRASARGLAASDVARGNAFSNILAATVRPVWGFSSLIVVAYPYLAGALNWPSVTIDDATKDIVQMVIMFYFGGRTIEKVLQIVHDKKK